MNQNSSISMSKVSYVAGYTHIRSNHFQLCINVSRNLVNISIHQDKVSGQKDMQVDLFVAHSGKKAY